MTNTSPLHVDNSGSISKPKTQSPKTIQAWSQARDSFTRTLFGGAVLVILAIAYVVALFCKIENANSILVVLGSGLGVLVGSRDRGPSSDT
jgi:hypothetical protein